MTAGALLLAGRLLGAESDEDAERRELLPTEVFRTPADIARLVYPETVQTPALDIVDAKLMAAFNGTGKRRLIITMAPQEGKSERVSRAFPVWVLQRNPDLMIANIGYQDAISRRWGQAVRDDIEAFPELGITLSKGSVAANYWRVKGRRGGMVTSSVMGALTGRRVDLMIIDDPHKDDLEASSEVLRARIKQWWRTVASTRISPNGIVVVIQTRWHEDDLSGFLTGPENDNRDAWDLVNIPAQAEHDPARGTECKCAGQRAGCLGYDILNRAPGEYMVSARGRTPEQWDERRREAGSRAWTAMFQGHPAPDDGDVFKRTWWKWYSVPRAVERGDGTWHALGATQVIMSVDCAFKDTDSSDYVVIGVWARSGMRAWLLDVRKERLNFTSTLVEIAAMAKKWPQATLKLVEDKANGTAVINVMNSKLGGMLPYNPTESKLSRAYSVQPFIEAGNVELPDPATLDVPWVSDYVNELASFPNGTHDDQVDMTTQALMRMLILGAGGAAEFLKSLEAENRSAAGDAGDLGHTYWSHGGEQQTPHNPLDI